MKETITMATEKTLEDYKDTFQALADSDKDSVPVINHLGEEFDQHYRKGDFIKKAKELLPEYFKEYYKADWDYVEGRIKDYLDYLEKNI